MAIISKDLCLRIDEVEYDNFQNVLDLFEAQDILYIGCDNGCGRGRDGHRWWVGDHEDDYRRPG